MLRKSQQFKDLEKTSWTGRSAGAKGPMETEFGVLENQGECGLEPGERREIEKGTGQRSTEQIDLGGLWSCSRASSLRAVRGTWEHSSESVVLSG